MKKRLFAILLAVTMLLAACAAAADPTTVPARGRWDGDTFLSPFFGLRFDMPETWDAMTEMELVEIYWNIGAFLPMANAELTSDAYEVAEFLGIMDVFAMTIVDEMESPDKPMGRVAITIMRLSDDMAHMTALDWLNHLAEEMQEAEEPSVVRDGTTRIGSLYWYFMDTPDEDLDQRTFVNLEGRFIRVITIGYTHDEYLNDILNMFSPYS